MASVQIADLKNNLSAYLRKVRTGEEVIICDRKSPIAKIVPLSASDLDLETRELIARESCAARSRFDADAFFAIGRGVRMPRVSDLPRYSVLWISRGGWMLAFWDTSALVKAVRLSISPALISFSRRQRCADGVVGHRGRGAQCLSALATGRPSLSYCVSSILQAFIGAAGFFQGSGALRPC